MFEINNIKIEWLGHASFRIETPDNKIIYLDPYNITTYKNDANYIFITHGHYDHKSIPDINRLKNNSTKIILPLQEKGSVSGNIKYMNPNEEININNINIKSIPAYNIDKGFHPKSNNWLGYIITLENTSIYHSGDTDFIPEMKSLKNIAVAMLPVGGTYTMNASEASDAVNTFNPQYAIPMHWGSIVGGKDDAIKFKNNVIDSKVIIMS